MDYLVSYTVWQNGLEYRQHFVSGTDDLGKNLRRIAAVAAYSASSSRSIRSWAT
jgi:hypothetical protein